MGVAQLLADLTGQLGDPGVVIPRGLTDELLQGFAFVVVQVGDGLDIFVVQVGEESAT